LRQSKEERRVGGNVDRESPRCACGDRDCGRRHRLERMVVVHEQGFDAGGIARDRSMLALEQEKRAKALELAALLGSVIELGDIVGLPTPTLKTVHHLCLLLQQSVLRSGHGLSLN
jgi:ketopantoate reductase